MMKKHLIIFFLLLFGAISNIEAYKINASYSIDELCVDYLEYRSKTFADINYPGLSFTSKIGQYRLPIDNRFISVPFDATNFRVSYTLSDPQTIKLKTKPYINNGETTNGDIIKDLKEIVDVPIVSSPIISTLEFTNKIVSLQICPFRISDNGIELLFYPDISIDLQWDAEPVLNKDRFNNNEADKSLTESFVENPFDVIDNQYVTDRSKELMLNPAYSYVVITTDEFKEPLKRLAALRALKGFNPLIITMKEIMSPKKEWNVGTGIVSEIEIIRNFMKYAANAYKSRYFLFAGKYPDIPFAIGNSFYDTNIPTDLFFSNLTEKYVLNDESTPGYYYDNVIFSPDVYVGRIPFETTEEIDNYVDKLIRYEYNPEGRDMSYLNRSLLTRQNDRVTNQYFYDEMISSYYDVYNNVKIFNANNYELTGSEVILYVNNNPCGNYNFMGHGNPEGVVVSTIDKKNNCGIVALTKQNSYYIPETSNGLDMLNNKYYPAWSYSASCLLMPYDIYQDYNVVKNFGESFILGKDYGGVAFLGNTRSSSAPDGIVMFDYFFKTLKQWYENDAMMKRGVFAGTLMAMAKYASYAGYHENLIHNLLGDPLVPLWIRDPNRILFTSTNISNETRSINLSNNRFNTCYLGIIDVNSGESTCVSLNESSLGNITNYNNKIYTVYEKNSLPTVLPAYIRGTAINKPVDFFCGKLTMGNSSTDSSISDTVMVNAKMKIEAFGNLNIEKNTFINAELDIYSYGNVYLKDIVIPSWVKVKINAQRIYQTNVFGATSGNVELIERNGKLFNQATDNKIVIPGKTWWYQSDHCSPGGVAYYGVTIGEEDIIDEENWYSVDITKLLYDFKDGKTYSDEKIHLCHVREVDGELFSRWNHDEICQFEPIRDIILYLSDYGNKDIQTALICKIGQEGTQLRIGSEKIWADCEIESISEVESCGNTFKCYTAKWIEDSCSKDGANLHRYSVKNKYLEKIGHYDNEFFFMPFNGCWIGGYYVSPELAYVTNPDGSILYEGTLYGGEKGFKLWEYEPDGVENVIVNTIDLTGKWYNVNGIEINRPTSPGVYIHQIDNKSEKIIIH